MKLSRKEKSITILSSLLIILIFVSIYFFFIQPKKAQMDLKETELKTEQQLLSVLQNKINETNSDTFESTVELRKQVPVKPLTEKLLLDIEKAEVVSNSFVVAMDFGDGEITEEDNLVEEVEKELSGEKEEEEEEQKETVPLPKGVHKIIFNLTVESPGYFELEKFVSTLENAARILVVEKIDFTGKNEVVSLDQEEEKLTYLVSIASFYMPSLTDLIEQLPQVDAPKPSNKLNPFTSFGKLSSYNQNDSVEDDSEGENETANNQNSNSNSEQRDLIENYIEYTVQPGDTLYSISMKFLHSKDGIEKIKETNELESDELYVGQTLLIRID